jgi:hypothetical protein
MFFLSSIISNERSSQTIVKSKITGGPGEIVLLVFLKLTLSLSLDRTNSKSEDDHEGQKLGRNCVIHQIWLQTE